MEELSNLSEAERALFEAVQNGKEAVGARDGPSIGGPTLRALLLRASREKWASVRIRQYKIDGDVDLSYETIDCSWIAVNCRFSHNITLNYSSIRTITFTDCRFFESISGLYLNLKGAFVFMYSQIDGGLNLYGAHIGGDLACDGATLLNPSGRALDLTSATIENDLTLRSAEVDGGEAKRFHSHGEVCLHGAKIGGTLSCSGGLFQAGHSREFGAAITAQTATIGGYAHLRRSPLTGEQFTAVGAIDFHGASIGGECLFEEGVMTAAGTSAVPLRMTSGRIGDELSLEGASTRGLVTLDRATIEGDLRLVGATLKARESKADDPDRAGALSLAFSIVKSRLVWEPKEVSGRVNLHHATVGILDDEKGAWAGSVVELGGFKYSGLGKRAARWSYQDRISWLEGSASANESQPYEQVIRVLRDLGQESDARQIAIAKQKWLRAHDPSLEANVSKKIMAAVWRWFLDYTIAYGYKPWRAMVWALLFVGFGTVIFYEADRNHAMMPTSDWSRRPLWGPATDPAHQERLSVASRVYVENGYPQFFAPIYSADTFLPIVNLRQRDFWIPNPVNFYGRLALGFLWLQTLAGWVLTSALVVALSGLVNKEKRQ